MNKDIALDRHANLSRVILLRLIWEGDIDRKRVEKLAKEELELSNLKPEDFREQIDIDELDFDERKEFDKTIHFDEDFLSKLASIRMEEFDSAPVIQHKQVLERAVTIAYRDVVEDE